jgi:hypothetical protein
MLTIFIMGVIMYIEFISDSELTQISGGNGQGVMTYLDTAGVSLGGNPYAAGSFLQNLTAVPANPNAYGTFGVFIVRNENPNDPIPGVGVSTHL